MVNQFGYNLEKVLQYICSVGRKIRIARVFQNLTQKELGVKCGFPEATAVQRISQYEQNQKFPKAEQIKILADTLGIDESAFYKLDLSDSKLVCHLLFDLEELYGLRPTKIDGKYYLAFRSSLFNDDSNKFLEDWYNKLNENKSDEYNIWKLAYFKNHSSEIERIEDEYDLEVYNKAMAEYKKNPVTYSHEEVGKMLDTDKI